MSILERSIDTSNPLFVSLNISQATVNIEYHNSSITDIRIIFLCDLSGWITIQDEGLFGHRPEICGAVFGGGFNPTKAYTITIGMKAEHVTILSILYAEEILEEWIFQAPQSNVLSEQKNYVLYSVMQQATPKTQWGMTTSYHPVEG